MTTKHRNKKGYPYVAEAVPGGARYYALSAIMSQLILFEVKERSFENPAFSQHLFARMPPHMGIKGS